MAFNFKRYTSNNPLLQEIEEEVTVSSSGVEMGQMTEDVDIWQLAGEHLEDFRSDLANAHAIASQNGDKDWLQALNRIALRLDALESAMADANAKLGVLKMSEEFEDGNVSNIENYGSTETEEMEGMGSQMNEDDKAPLMAVEKAALAAKAANIDRETVVNIVNQTYGKGMSASLFK